LGGAKGGGDGLNGGKTITANNTSQKKSKGNPEAFHSRRNAEKSNTGLDTDPARKEKKRAEGEISWREH